jgi:adenylate cyclase
MNPKREQARPDFEAAGLLDGLDEPAREARLRLLSHLHDSGIGLEELREAATHDRLVILPAEHALGGEARYSAREICDEVGLPVDYFQAVRRAQGLAAEDPDARAYSDDDLDAARITARFYQLGLDPEAMLEVARVLGRGLAQTADAVGELFRESFIRGGVSEEELGIRNAEAAREWIPQFAPLLGYLLKQHVRERLRHQAVSQAMLEAGEVPGAQDVAVSFADMVAFTRLGERMGPEEVGNIATRLGEMAAECATPPVRLVKTIGDAAMLVGPDAEALLTSTLALVESAEEADDLPPLRAGAAYGPALNRSGDWYGHTVNVASRITAKAEPGTLVATKELCEAAGDVCTWENAGSHALKGIEDELELFRAEPRSGDDAA